MGGLPAAPPVRRDEGMENQLMQAGGEKSHGDRRAMSDFIIAQKQAKPDEIQRQMRGHRIAQIGGRSKCWSRGLSIVELHPAKDPEAAKDEASNRVAHDRGTLCEDRPRRFRQTAVQKGQDHLVEREGRCHCDRVANNDPSIAGSLAKDESAAQQKAGDHPGRETSSIGE